jgi:hypothetical protein
MAHAFPCDMRRFGGQGPSVVKAGNRKKAK